MEWIKNLHISILAFDIAQFFLSLNYQIILIILGKAGSDLRIFSFFSSYLINKQTQYVWNNFISSFFRADIDVKQESAFFFILSTLYITPIFYIFKKRSSSLLSSISISTLFFIDDSLFIS